MMREIKYKAYSHKYKKVYDVDCLRFLDGELVLIGINFDGITVMDDPKEFQLMEYTGLKDKNNVEIYKGYIVRLGDNVIHEGVLVVCEWLDWKLMNAYKFITGENKGKFTDMLDTWRTYEVIGNIYENPELLEV